MLPQFEWNHPLALCILLTILMLVIVLGLPEWLRLFMPLISR